MSEKPENIMRTTRDDARVAAQEIATPEFLAWFDSLTDEDIAAQIASNPDAAPELTDEWFARARLVIPPGARSERKPPEPRAVRFDEHSFWVELADGRTLGVPLAWFPRLLDATPDQRARVELSPSGLHWDEIDEDISITGLLAGRGDQTRAQGGRVIEDRPLRRPEPVVYRIKDAGSTILGLATGETRAIE